jgi:hypothetical protein
LYQLKYFLAISVFLGVLGQTFSKLCIVANYRINQEYIAKNLCVNRYKPKSCCQGKCYLNKQLAKDEDQQPSSNNNGHKEETAVQFFAEEQSAIRFGITATAIPGIAYYQANELQDFSSSFFQPPRI